MSHLRATAWFALTAVVALAFARERHANAQQQKPDAGTLPRFDAEPFSDQKTDAPTLEEWRAAKPVAITAGSWCNAYRVREWMKLDCSIATSSITMIGGQRDGVRLFLKMQKESPVPQGGELILPVRRGDRRVLEWSTFGDGYEGPGAPEHAFMISESWVAGEETPVIITR